MKIYRLFGVLMLSSLSFSACSLKEESGVSEQALELPSTIVKRETLPLNYTVIGNIVSDHRVAITSRIVAYIRDIQVEEGMLIKRGQVLVTLDENDVSAAIAQARAALNSAAAQLADAESDLQRYQRLLEEDSVPESDVRKIQLLRDTARNQVNSAGAALDSALAQRQYTTIKSPVNGLVVARHRRDGDLASPGVSILSVESQDGLLFQTYLPERHLNLVNPGDKVVLDLDSFPAVVTGEILRVVPSADPVTRRFKVDVAFPEGSTSKNTLIPGMFGRAKFVLGASTRPVIPAAALLERGGLTGVFVLGHDNRARFRWLRLGREFDSTVEVIAGLDDGERILSIAQPGIREGSLIAGNSAEKSLNDKKRSKKDERHDAGTVEN